MGGGHGWANQYFVWEKGNWIRIKVGGGSHTFQFGRLKGKTYFNLGDGRARTNSIWEMEGQKTYFNLGDGRAKDLFQFGRWKGKTYFNLNAPLPQFCPEQPSATKRNLALL